MADFAKDEVLAVKLSFRIDIDAVNKIGPFDSGFQLLR